MKLKNDFSNETRHLWLGHWECGLCKKNGQTTGGLELHHIYGRVSDSPFNSVVLCKKCHASIAHNDDEHRKLLAYTIRYLLKIHYRPVPEDYLFLETIHRDTVFVTKYLL
jgi:hypothetical protein